MGRDKDPFRKRWHSQDGKRRGEYGDEYHRYEDDFDYEEDEEFERKDDFDEEGLNFPEGRSAPQLPPFPSRNKNIYPRRPRVRHVPEEMTPRPPIRPTQVTRSKRQAYPPEDLQPSGRRSTGSYQRPAQQRTRARSDGPIQPPSSYTARRVPVRPRKRSVWPIFLGGCAAGAVSLVLALAVLVWIGIHSVSNDVISHAPNKVIPEEPTTQSVPLSALSQLIVCDAAGNISLSVDPNATASNAVITTTKRVQTDDQNVANQAFRQIAVSVAAQPPSQPLTCEGLRANPPSTSNAAPTAIATATNNSVLSVNVVFPANRASLATVDVAITLPKLVAQSQDPTHPFTSTLISLPNSQGTINIDGISGKMDVQDLSGDITVKNGTLVDGSKLQAQEGKLTFNGTIWPRALPPNQQASVFFSGANLIDLTLPETSSVMIAATTNARTTKITSDLPIQVTTNDDGSSSYYGPFNPVVPTDRNTAPQLTLQASSGNISIHKAKVG